MTDDTEKQASFSWENFTEEEILNFLGPKDTYTIMKCTKCGYEESVPDWVLGEFHEEDIATGHANREVSTECPRCNGAMFKKK